MRKLFSLLFLFTLSFTSCDDIIDEEDLDNIYVQASFEGFWASDIYSSEESITFQSFLVYGQGYLIEAVVYNLPNKVLGDYSIFPVSIEQDAIVYNDLSLIGVEFKFVDNNTFILYDCYGFPEVTYYRITQSEFLTADNVVTEFYMRGEINDLPSRTNLLFDHAFNKVRKLLGV
ncbi:MAG: hypothetical protein LBB27_00320 [Tannerellaceae bacterium]|jgi:hypothetical protein|nr:hypothetical protein [Tannerellaceae bacterium]